MNPAFFGTWKLDRSRSTGKEAFAKAMGVPDDKFAIFDKLELTFTIAPKGSAYEYEFDFVGSPAARSTSYIITIGHPIKVDALDGSKAELVLNVDGDTVIESYKTDKGNWTTTRTVCGDEMTLVSVAGDATLTHILVKV
ncbi:fatty acid-binding protein, intestinal [Plakobranchus ocellatus]|uniref:Fatty acid-binding protein, intestinal n=1 Tax=Plakobranchus ocellatus TaxID=259542 RepID=A0AAV4ARZ0_9GAST|nr:fatty acid-binding protein, intestinal [Plakobranchus ocellatus]